METLLSALKSLCLNWVASSFNSSLHTRSLSDWPRVWRPELLIQAVTKSRPALEPTQSVLGINGPEREADRGSECVDPSTFTSVRLHSVKLRQKYKFTFKLSVTNWLVELHRTEEVRGSNGHISSYITHLWCVSWETVQYRLSSSSRMRPQYIMFLLRRNSSSWSNNSKRSDKLLVNHSIHWLQNAHGTALQTSCFEIAPSKLKDKWVRIFTFTFVFIDVFRGARDATMEHSFWFYKQTCSWRQILLRFRLTHSTDFLVFLRCKATI